MSKNLEITGQLVKESQRWGETVIAMVRSEGGAPVTVKTTAEEGELSPGLTYRFYGRWVNHYKYGRQFAAETFVAVAPADEAGIVAYLQRAPNVGPRRARALWQLYRGDAVKELRLNPQKVVERLQSRGFTVPLAAEAAAYLDQEKDLEAASIDLASLLAGKGFPRKTARKAIRAWGNRAADMVRRNPYLLMRFRGCGFGRADTLYLELGRRPDKLKRQALALWYAISRETEGSSWVPVEFAMETLRQAVGGTRVRPVDAVKLGRRAGLLAVHRNGGGPPWITEAGRAIAEGEIAERAAWLASLPPSWPDLDGLDVSPHQLERLREALGHGRIAVFGGSPGTGKTYTAARLVARIIQHHGAAKVAVVAPTGKAAVRITQSLEEYGLPIRARTIHSYLVPMEVEEGYRSRALGATGWTFEHGPDNPVEETYIVVDESSMIDCEIMASLLGALPEGANLLLVGDLNQLPPVGHGAPLRDLLRCGVAAGELTEIRRNAGAIVRTCAQIRDNAPLVIPDHLDMAAGGNLVLKPAVAPQVAQERVVSLVRNIRDRALVDPVWECQVVVAVNEKSPLSRRELNAILQAELNGRNRAEGARFWKDDKVICLKNSRFPAVLDLTDLDDDALEGFVQVREDEGIGQGVELYVANGELGRVVEDSPTKMIVEFLHPRRVVLVPKVGGSSEDGDAEGSAANFDLGYAISVHKSQGSEWPVVIVALDDSGGARMVCDRSWIYTAISRARKACFLVGQLSTIEAMCRRQKIGQRKTFLVERFQDEVEKLLVAAKAKAMAKDALEEKREEREVAGGVDSGEVGAEAGADGETGKATATETVPCPV